MRLFQSELVLVMQVLSVGSAGGVAVSRIVGTGGGG